MMLGRNSFHCRSKLVLQICLNSISSKVIKRNKNLDCFTMMVVLDELYATQDVKTYEVNFLSS